MAESIFNIATVYSSKLTPVYITDQYATVLSAINAYRNTKIFPFTIQKTGNSSCTDMPSDALSSIEWCVLCYGNSTRITVLLTVFSGAGAGNGNTYVRNIFDGAYSNEWKQL